jgi:HlyD family secretion protein
MAKSRNYGGLIALLVLVAAAAAGTWYYFDNKNDKQPEFNTAKVTRGDIIQTVTATGDLQPVITVDVGAQVSGQVQDVLVDFNSKVKAGDVLARIDPSTAEQKLRQAQADLESAKANNQLLKITADRTNDLFKKNLVSQSELDNANAQLAQSNAAMLTRNAAVENAKLDLDHCTISSPIDGMVLNRNTDKGRTVNSSMNAPTLFTLVNDLTQMQINAAIAEADIGTIVEGQDVTFTVDAFPNRTFRGTVRQVRNAATTSSSVVSYATIINVNNDDLKLKPGMTANVSVIIAQKTGVLRVGNAALRVRIPAELLPKVPEAATSGKAAAPAAGAMTDQERFAAIRSIMTDAGIQRGTPPTPEQTEKAKKLAQDKGLDPEVITQMLQRMAQGGGRRGGGGGGSGPSDRGFSNTVVTRTLYKLADPNAPTKKIEPVSVRLGISDGVTTEVLSGLDENDNVITAVTLPNAAGAAAGGPQNPFQQGGRGLGGGGGGGGRGR